jgi:hypothetical protein
MPGYTITETLRELKIGIYRLRKLMLALGIEPTNSSNEHGACKVLSGEQLEQLRMALVETTLTTAITTKLEAGERIVHVAGQDDPIAAQFAAVWRELHALRQMIDVSQVNFSSRGHFSASTERQPSKSSQPTQIGIGKARGSWLAVNHGANSPYAAKGWLCWNVTTLESDATALAAIKEWMDDPRHKSGTWKRCGQENCPCVTI